MPGPGNLGAAPLGGGRCRFRVWAPAAREVAVHLVAPRDRLLPLAPAGGGYHEGVADGVAPGALYLFRLDGGDERPDPASRCQPRGVHGPSEVVDPAFAWTDASWRGLPLAAYVIYELHVGAFSAEGTFDGVRRGLDALARLGVTAVELMPVAQFPGERNWGYDGVYPYAPHPAYGGAAGMRALVDACHARGLAVLLDVVYNHLGPEGNYLARFGPYFTDRYRTPWGAAVNLDGPGSDAVRGFFIENAVYWVEEFRVDALRLDAVHAIFDQSVRPFLPELASAVHAAGARLGRAAHVIAESNLNDPRLVRPAEAGGYGLDAQWSDDFHHALHTALTDERTGYYQDFDGVRDLARALAHGFVLDGRYSAFRGRRHGAPSTDVPAERFVVSAQTHDQVGNRALGDRLSGLVSFEALKLAAGAVLLSPFVPLLFMGEEYGEPAPFLYFTSHTDPALAEAVRRGRREEFAGFAWPSPPPDPQDDETFRRSRLTRSLAQEDPHRTLLAYYTELIRLRKTIPALAVLSKETQEVSVLEEARALSVRRWTGLGAPSDRGDRGPADRSRAVGGAGAERADGGATEVLIALNFGRAASRVPVPRGRWRLLLDSAAPRWGGGGSGVPADLASDGRTEVETASESAVVLERTAS